MLFKAEAWVDFRGSTVAADVCPQILLLLQKRRRVFTEKGKVCPSNSKLVCALCFGNQEIKEVAQVHILNVCGPTVEQ